jgi:hypothetical protein
MIGGRRGEPQRNPQDAVPALPGVSTVFHYSQPPLSAKGVGPIRGVQRLPALHGICTEFSRLHTKLSIPDTRKPYFSRHLPMLRRTDKAEVPSSSLGAPIFSKSCRNKCCCCRPTASANLVGSRIGRGLIEHLRCASLHSRHCRSLPVHGRAHAELNDLGGNSPLKRRLHVHDVNAVMSYRFEPPLLGPI